MVWSRYTTVLGTECGGTSQCESSIPELGGLDGFDIFFFAGFLSDAESERTGEKVGKSSRDQESNL
jgi:hypothetical protein